MVTTNNSAKNHWTEAKRKCDLYYTLTYQISSQYRFGNIQEWWDVTKTKIKYLTMQISKQKWSK
jgi:hypothetical protein